MEKEKNSIHDFDYNLICEYFNELERQGPGSDEVTEKALGFIENLPDDARIVDIGCGTGGQTITLALNTKGKITAVDLFPAFIGSLEKNAKDNYLDDRIEGMIASMDNLPFLDNYYDLIWSEGAIYNIGFERGLKEWHQYLKKNGYIAVSEVSWFTKERPKEIEDFWMDAYPEIDTIPQKVRIMEEAGYIPVAHFVLPENCWIENFYEPQEEVRKSFMAKYKHDQNVRNFIVSEKHEQELYMKYKDYYGYVFYIGKKYESGLIF